MSNIICTVETVVAPQIVEEVTVTPLIVNEEIPISVRWGIDGDDAYVYIAYASNDLGDDFTTIFSPNLDYIAILNSIEEIASPTKDNFVGLWKNYKGLQGIQGIQGLLGIQGPIGIQGRIGIQGTTGSQGVQGTQGLIGIQGRVGLQGVQGIQGIVGTQGIIGIQGRIGLQGIKGIQGTQGVIGIQGNTGLLGTQGTQGIYGIQGTIGIQGPQGLQGIQGLKGDKGDTGAQGIQGIQGPQGDKGDTGDTGVYIGTEEPTDPLKNVWIDPNGQGIELYSDQYTTTLLKIVDSNTILATGDLQGDFMSLITGDITSVAAWVTTASTSGVVTIQIRNLTTGNDVLSTKLTIDATETKSLTAAVPYVINPLYKGVTVGDIIAIDIDIAGTGTKGLSVTITISESLV